MEPAAAVENIRSIKYSHKSVHASALKKNSSMPGIIGL